MHTVRLVAPIGYGLGAYGSVAVRFRLVSDVGDGRTVAMPETLDDYRFRFVRMQERLAERSQGREPTWARRPFTGQKTTLTMVPGRYYVFAECGEGSSHVRGLEVKFTVRNETSAMQSMDVSVPLPASDMKRYGESRPQ